MFAGDEARDLVIQHLNGLGNVVNLQKYVLETYDNLRWGIEAQIDNGKVPIEVSCVLNSDMAHRGVPGQIRL
jgi:hypothetical protein